MTSFGEMTPEERTRWRELPATKAFFDLLAEAHAMARNRTIELVFACKPDAARAQSGVVHAFEWLSRVVETPETMPPVEDIESKFSDPAAPPPRKWEKR